MRKATIEVTIQPKKNRITRLTLGEMMTTENKPKTVSFFVFFSTLLMLLGIVLSNQTMQVSAIWFMLFELTSGEIIRYNVSLGKEENDDDDEDHLCHCH